MHHVNVPVFYRTRRRVATFTVLFPYATGVAFRNLFLAHTSLEPRVADLEATRPSSDIVLYCHTCSVQ